MFFRGSPCLTLSFASVAQLRLVRIEASDNVVRTTAKLRLSFLHSPAANAVAGINKAIIATEKCFMFLLRMVLPTYPLRNRPRPRQSPHRHPPKSGARTTTGLVRRVYEEGPCRIKRHCARLRSLSWTEADLSFEASLAARRYCRLAGSALASRLGLALLIDADAFGALGRVRMYRGSGMNIDGSTRYLAGVVDRCAHPNQQSHSED